MLLGISILTNIPGIRFSGKVKNPVGRGVPAFVYLNYVFGRSTVLATKMQIEGQLKYEVHGCIGVLMLTLLQYLTRKMFIAMRTHFFLSCSRPLASINWSNMKRRHSMLLRSSIELTASWSASVKSMKSHVC